MEVHFPSVDWLNCPRTQLTALVGGVCLQSKKNFSALFSQNIFFTRRGHFKELQVKGNLFNCSQIWTVASLTYKKQKSVCKFLISKYFFQERFLYDHAIFFKPISKMFCNFSLELNMANRRHVTFLALWHQKLRNTLNKR